MLEWIIIGAIALFAGKCLVTFWEDIRQWLNTVAADAVERAFGYQARQRMHRAVAFIDKVMSKVRNTSIVYTKKSYSDLYFDKTTIICETGISDIDQDVVREIEKQGQIVQQFEYR